MFCLEENSLFFRSNKILHFENWGKTDISAIEGGYIDSKLHLLSYELIDSSYPTGAW